MFGVLVTSCVLLALTLSRTAARQYDVGAEALRLYGEELSGVLRQFRRTTEYMELLQEKVAELRHLFVDAYLEVKRRHLEGTLPRRLADQCGYNPRPPVARSYIEDRARRDVKEAVNNLIIVRAVNSLCSAHMKRCFRDVAFEVAGEALHTSIDCMGPVDTAAFSTRLPFGGDPGSVKDHHHKVATGGASYNSLTARPTAKPVETPVDKTLRVYKQQKT